VAEPVIANLAPQYSNINKHVMSDINLFRGGEIMICGQLAAPCLLPKPSIAARGGVLNQVNYYVRLSYLNSKSNIRNYDKIVKIWN